MTRAIKAHLNNPKWRLAKAGETKREFLEIDFSQFSKGDLLEKAKVLSIVRRNVSLARSLGVPIKIKKNYTEEELSFLFSLLNQKWEKAPLQYGKSSLSLLL